MPKLRPFDSDSRKIPVPLGGLITALVALGFGLWSSGAAGSILDSAEIVVTEVEPAEPNQGQNLNAYFSSFRAVGIEGALSDPNDQDIYEFTVGPDWDVQLLFEIQAVEDKAITAIAAGPDSRVYFVSENSVWRIDLARPAEPAEWVVTSEDLAAILDLEDGSALEVGPIAANQDPNGPAVLLIGLGPAESPAGGTLVALDTDDELSVVATRDDVTAVTGIAQVEWAALTADETGRFYGADQASGSVLKIDRQAGAEPAAYLVSRYTDAGDLQDAIERDVMEDVSDGLTIIPETILAETDGDFMVNSLVAGSGAYAVSGKDAFYLGQLGPAFGGSGGITRILVNPLDAEDVTFEEFFTPAAEDADLLNPSALALDTSGDSPFGQFLYMGTFGPSLGDDFDGQVYVVDADGQISPFVTAYRQNGQPAMMDELEVTGFFDVVDMAFPPTLTGPFGAYLYVLSENIDQNGAAAGGYNSDLWRIDPAGVAELFVEDIADGVISLAFGGFDYDNDLFVATFSHSVGDGKVLRVDSEGNVETFFDFGQFSSDLSVCDLAFVPTDLAVDSPLAGALVLTLQSSTSTYVVQLAPDGETYWTWAGGLDTGDVSSGDLAFGRDDALVIAQQGDRSLLQLEYLGLFDYTFEQLQTRVMLEEDPESVGFAPYALVQVADQPRILRLADSGNPADIATEVGPSILDVAEAPADGSKPVSFVFDAAGDLYCYIRNLGEFCTSQRDEAGGFTEFTTLLTRNQIDGFTGLVDAQLAQLAWSSADGGLLAIGSNGTDANAEELPSQEFDDLLVWMGNTLRGQYEPNALVDVGDLTQMRLGLLGPGGYFEYVASGTVLDETIEDLAEGTYRLTIGSILNSSDAYQLVITLDSTLPGQLICRESTGPVELTREDGRRLVLSHQGSGQSRLDYLQEPNGILTQMSALTILGPNISTSVSLVNLDEPNDMVLDEIVLYGSMGRLEYLGTLALLRGAEFTRGTVEQAVLGTVRDVEAVQYAFGNFQAVNLGDADTTDHQLRAKGIGDLRVRHDVQNITVLDYNSGNSYDSIDIGGIMADSIIWGRRIKECLVRNGRAQAAALDASYLSCTAGGGSLGLVRIEQGDVVSTGFYADKGIERVELLCGNLDSSTIETLAANSWVGTVLVGRAAGAADDESGGDILNCRIAADRRVIRVHADGNIDEDCIIGADGRIDTVSCRGDCSGTISSVRIGEILAGFDRDGQKVPEEGAFTGGNFGGTVYVTNTLDLLSATGSIEDADIRANLLYQGGWIKSIFAEDGFLDSTVTFNKKVTRIMVGYENGRRDRIVNAGADVSGTISGPRLGRLYYTGGNTATLSVKHLGPVKDDQPGN